MKTPEELDFLRYRDAGDAAALARVFDAVAPKLLLLAQHLTRDAGAEDLVQTTFLHAMSAAGSYDGRGSLMGWMAGILAHRAVDERRRAGVRSSDRLPPVLPGGADPLAEAIDREALERITATIDGLEEPLRQVLVLRAIHGFSPSEIAHALGRAQGTVRMQLLRARERLKERLPRGLAVPAAFLHDGGRGLADVRAQVLARATAAGVAAVGSGGASLLGWIGALACCAGLAGFLWWRPMLHPQRESHDVLEASERSASSSTARATSSEIAPAVAQPGARVERRQAVEVEPSGAPADPRIDGGIEVEGLVLSLERAPVAGARIVAVEPGSAGAARELALSDEHGRFTVRVPPETLLAARKAGLQPSGGRRGGSRVRAQPGEKAVVTLTTGANGHRLAGRVVDRRGEPAGEALVAIAVDEDARKRPEGMPRGRERTGNKPLDREAFVLAADASGSFATDEAPAGRALVLARAPGAGLVGWTFADVAAGRENRCEVVLAEGGAIAGRVLDERGCPAAGLDVHGEWVGERELGAVDDDGWGPLFTDREVVTAADGSFLLDGLLPGQHEVGVRIGDKTLATERFALTAGEARRWDVEVTATVPLSVRVIGPAGEALAGWGRAWRPADDLDWDLSRDIRMPVALDGEGRHRIAGVERVEHVLAVFAPGTGSEGRFSLFPCAIRSAIVPGLDELLVQVSATERPDAGISGTWVDARGQPCAGFELVLEHAGWSGPDPDRGRPTFRTDASGRFAIGALAPAEYVVLADEDAVYPRDTPLARCVLRPGEVEELGSLSLPDPTRLVIELAAEDGGAIDDPLAHLFDPSFESGLGGYMHWSSDERVFRSDPVFPGEALLSVSTAGRAEIWQRIRIEPLPENRLSLVVRRGRPVEFVVDVPLPENLASVAETRAVGELQVLLRTPDGTPALWRHVEAPFDGGGERRLRFTLALAPGRYRGSFEDHTIARVGERPRRSAGADFEVSATAENAPVHVVIR